VNDRMTICAKQIAFIEFGFDQLQPRRYPSVYAEILYRRIAVVKLKRRLVLLEPTPSAFATQIFDSLEFPFST
jgi:hypothetical protein